ncbi:PREDICTED: uncharacterized protein LOC109239194 [Nicotiana attenuata]|uniref:uncharacterized protein LOC109239194 n=1 Tax=Nicotiana attenuata TaxID=49451 RepID=UPI00090560FB|nr:PREDICTED: uncharacterized protein LOC109239194 [Nicotiana attenuata]
MVQLFRVRGPTKGTNSYCFPRKLHKSTAPAIKISSCQSAKEIWEALQAAHEGTTQVKQSKIDMLKTEYKLFRMKDDESIQDMHNRFTSIINELHSLGEIIPRNKLVKKILSVLPSSWECKVNAITKAKDLQEPTIDELVGNLKTYEMKKKKDNERREPKMEKNLVFKTDNNDSCGVDGDMAYLTRRFQKMKDQYKNNFDKAAKRNPIPDKCFKRKNVTDNVVKQAFAAWGDSSSESEEENDHGDISMMAVESKANDRGSGLEGKIGELKLESRPENSQKGDEVASEAHNKLETLQAGSVSFGNGKKGYILGVVRIEKPLSHSIKNVYYVNELKYCLLSVSQICDKENRVKFVSKICTVTNLVTGEEARSCKLHVSEQIGQEGLGSLCAQVKFQGSQSVRCMCKRTKDETFEVFIAFIKKIQVKIGNKVACIKSDHGTEFDNAKFDEFYTDNEEALGKFDAKSDEGIFVGYSS